MTLIVLAATMGSKYGGLKQLEGMGLNGETILDFLHDDKIQVVFRVSEMMCKGIYSPNSFGKFS